MYAEIKNSQIIIALLKKYNIKKIVTSPGGRNAPFIGSVQKDPFFEVYSVVDERSASYFATGLSFESGEPVVAVCTGATASRNYLSALTEAFYRKLPIIAITCQFSATPSDYNSLQPQLIDRRVSQTDVKCLSVDVPVVTDRRGFEECILAINNALTVATKRGGGPVHINMNNDLDCFSFYTGQMPDIRKIDYFQTEDLISATLSESLSKRLTGKNIAVLIGSHRIFSKSENAAIEKFIDSYNAIVVCDHTANYHGKNKVLITPFFLKRVSERPDIIIDIGSVIGDYNVKWLNYEAEYWRVSEGGEYYQRLAQLTCLFDCPESFFFESLAIKDNKPNSHTYFQTVSEIVSKIEVPDLPLGNIFIASKLSQKLPKNCSLHLAILNSLRSMNMFMLDESIDCISNVGGFGIDGAISTLIGQSMVNKNKLQFCVIGDLAFFYDMNALGIRHIGPNIRILLVNNGKGAEFYITPRIMDAFGEVLDDYIAASGHKHQAEAWAKSVGFEYISAKDKNEFLSLVDDFCDPNINKFDKPVLFEVFTKIPDEQDSLKLFTDINTVISTE